MKNLHSTLILICLLCLTVFLQKSLVSQRFPIELNNPDCPWCEASSSEEQINYIPYNTLTLRLFAPADPGFSADMLWLWTAYYFGSHAITDQTYTYLDFLLDRITDLAPEWQYPYSAGTMMLLLEADDAVNALKLATKGARLHSDVWWMTFYQGYILWNEFGDYQAASKCILRASKLEGAPAYLAGLSRTLESKSDSKQLDPILNDLVNSIIKDPDQQEMFSRRIKEK